MIKYSELETVFSQKGIKLEEYNLETDEEITLPYFVYTATDGTYFEADGINYLRMLTVGLAMIDETLNFPKQRIIESVLDDESTRYDKQINFDDEQRLYSITYTFSVFDDGFNQV